MPPLTTFATAERPIRMSGTPGLIRCQLRTLMKFLQELQEESGPDADTGSAVHEAVRAWHAGGDPGRALESMREALARYPLADLGDAAHQFLNYTQDPRNQDAQIVLLEQEVACCLEADSTDPTGQPVYLIGTPDQVRRGPDGLLRVYDIKTSRRDGWVLMQEHAYQIAAYCMGASAMLGEPVHPGALILTRRYSRTDPMMKPAGIFWEFAWDHSHLAAFMDGIRRAVAAVRGGRAAPQPGEHCKYCLARGIEGCAPLHAELVSVGVIAR